MDISPKPPQVGAPTFGLGLHGGKGTKPDKSGEPVLADSITALIRWQRRHDLNPAEQELAKHIEIVLGVLAKHEHVAPTLTVNP